MGRRVPVGLELKASLWLQTDRRPRDHGEDEVGRARTYSIEHPDTLYRSWVACAATRCWDARAERSG